jgi:hypothetical protein
MARRWPTFRITVPGRAAMVTAVLVAIATTGATQAAGARSFAPPRGKVFVGATGQPLRSYVAATRKHAPVYQEFVAWGQWLPGITDDARRARARLMIHITTRYGAREAITPAAIAHGRGDAWLIGLQRAIYDSHNVTYVRLMAEMDCYWNAYGAYNADGSRRDAAHSAAAYKRAWKRVTLIMRGGSLRHIDTVLRRLGMPALHARHDLPRPRVAMVWVAQVAGSPDVAGNQPSNYWPGAKWVDWVGTDFYSKYPNFSGLTKFYDAFPQRPFAFGEWAVWGSDAPGFVKELFGWAAAHSRAQMLVYNQGLRPNGPFRLSWYPRAAGELRRLLSSPRYPAFAPEFAR